MALQCLPEKSTIVDRKGTMIIVSDLEGGAAIEELQSADARNLAIREAAKLGLADPRINGFPQVKPLGADGELAGGGVAVATYMAEIPVMAKML